jgi:tape measure domain-containing protein
MTNLRNKMKATFETSNEVAIGMNQIRAIAKASRSDLSSVGTLYQRIAVSTKHLGTTQKEVAQVTEVITNSFLMSGTTASEAANSARQFAQGLASGALRGDEFRSVSENNVVLTNMLADGLNMTVGELRKFSHEGGLTAERILPILRGELEGTREAISNMDVTLSQARTLFSNSFTEMVDRVNTTFGVTNRLAVVIKTLSENIHIVTVAAAGLATVLLTNVVRGFVAWIVMSTAATVAGVVGFGSMLITLTKVLGGMFLKALGLALVKFRAFAIALAANPITLVVMGVLALASALIVLQERFAIFENAGIAFGKFKDIASAAFDFLKAGFEKAILNSEIFFSKIREKIANVLRDMGATSLADVIAPDESVAKLQKKLGAINEEMDKAGDRMSEALARPFNFISGDDGVSPVDAIKSKVAEMMSALGMGEGEEGGGMSSMFTGIVESFNSMGDSVMTKMAEMFPGLVKFWQVLKGGNPDPVEAEAASEEDGPMSWAEKWKLALEKFGEAWQSLKTGAGGAIDKLKEKYRSLDDVLMAGAQKSKKIAAIRRAILLKEAIMQGKAAILKAWNSAPFPANLPGVLLTTAQTGLVIRDIMKGQAHDGMDSLPSTGTYMLEKGERVLSTRANRDLTSFLANNNQGSKMKGPESVTLQVNGVSDPDLVVNALASRRGELEAMIRSISAENVRVAPF